MINISENLKFARENAGYSQNLTAKKTGIKQPNISAWENNINLPRIDFCIKLADFYGISLDELVGRDNYIPVTAETVNKAEKELFAQLKMLSPEQLLIVKNLLNEILNEMNNK